MKTTQSIATIASMVAGSIMIAQPSASFNGNAAGIPGPTDAAFGYQVLQFSTGGQRNTGTGTWALRLNVNGSDNTAIGMSALTSNESRNFNTAMGCESLLNNGCTTCIGGEKNTAAGFTSLYSNTDGNENTSGGAYSLYNNLTGSRNTAAGYMSLYSNTDVWGGVGEDNTAAGYYALRDNTTGTRNCALGNEALRLNIEGSYNTAIGYGALYTSGMWGGTIDGNTALGHSAMYGNQSGRYNSAIGQSALSSNVYGMYNVADGYQSMLNNTNGVQNVAMGLWANRDNLTKEGNVAIGVQSMLQGNASYNTAVGLDAMSNNTSATPGQYDMAFGYKSMMSSMIGVGVTCVGYQADVSGATQRTNATAIGANAIVNSSNKIRFGDAAFNMRVETQVAVTNVSDGRYKYNVTEEVKGLEFIQKLRPVVYNFDNAKFAAFIKPEIPEHASFTNHQPGTNPPGGRMTEFRRPEPTAATRAAERMSGFIAQEVAQAADETGYTFSGVIRPADEKDYYTVSYATFVVPLVKSVQEQQDMIERQQGTTDEILKELDAQNRELASLNAVAAVSNRNNGAAGVGDFSSASANFNMTVEPNPFSHETIIRYSAVPGFASATVVVRDFLGREVLNAAVTEQGHGSVKLSAEKLAAGTYICSMVVDGKTLMSKRIIITEK